jgi:Nucleotidyltransferase domain
VIEAYLTELTRRFGDLLGENLVGVYLHGSAALGDFSPKRSDLDVVAVVDRPLSAREKEAIAETSRSCPASGGLELHVVHECTIKPAEAPRFELHLGSGKVVDGSGHPGDADLPAHFAILREHGRALVGPPPASVFPPIPRAIASSRRASCARSSKAPSGRGPAGWSRRWSMRRSATDEA